MPSQLDRFDHHGLSIEIAASSPALTMRWSGVSDVRNPGELLLPFLMRMVERCKGKSLKLDFSSLEYMNSATVTPILNFVKALDANAIPATLVYDGAVDWQRINFQCMKTIARTLKHVRVESLDGGATSLRGAPSKS
jgi:hypothetical protein